MPNSGLTYRKITTKRKRDNQGTRRGAAWRGMARLGGEHGETMITTWRDRPGKVFVEIEIDFLSSGHVFTGNPLAHPDDQEPPSGEDERTIQAVDCEGKTVPLAEIDLLEKYCPFLNAAIWDAINDKEI